MHALTYAPDLYALSLVSNGSTGLCASHLPTVLKDEGSYGVIECHLARANPHWKDVASGDEALMIFQGPEGYITPNWYASKAQHGKVVPTWNYAIVHAYGRPEVMENKASRLRRHVSASFTAQQRDKPRPDLGRFLDAPQSYVNTMLRGIVELPASSSRALRASGR